MGVPHQGRHVESNLTSGYQCGLSHEVECICKELSSEVLYGVVTYMGRDV